MEEPCRQHSPLSCFKELKNAVINLCASPIPSYQQEHYAHSPNYWKITGKKLLCSSESLNMYIIISIKNAWHKIIQTLHTCNIYSNNEADKMQRLRLTGVYGQLGKGLIPGWDCVKGRCHVRSSDSADPSAPVLSLCTLHPLNSLKNPMIIFNKRRPLSIGEQQPAAWNHTDYTLHLYGQNNQNVNCGYSLMKEGRYSLHIILMVSMVTLFWQNKTLTLMCIAVKNARYTSRKKTKQKQAHTQSQDDHTNLHS